jgi:hypothetical protein
MLRALSIWPRARGLLAMVIGNWLWLLLVTMVVAYDHLLLVVAYGIWLFLLDIIGFNL